MGGVTGRAKARKQRVVLAVNSVEEALGALSARGADVIVFHDVPSDWPRLSSLPAGLRVDLPYREDCLEASKAPGLRVRIRLACRKLPSIEDACAALVRVSGADLPSLIEDVDALTPAEARRVVDLFLHDPGVSRPIDPMATILAALIQRKRVSLWDLFGPGAGRTRPEEEFLLALPREHPECLECRYFPLCEGYGAWAGACETWREVLADLAAAARRLSRLRGLSRESPPSRTTAAKGELPRDHDAADSPRGDLDRQPGKAAGQQPRLELPAAGGIECASIRSDPLKSSASCSACREPSSPPE